MKDQRHKQMMADLYRILERYESVPDNRDIIPDYFRQLYAELAAFNQKYKDSQIATSLSCGLLQGFMEIADTKGEQITYAEHTQQMAMRIDK